MKYDGVFMKNDGVFMKYDGIFMKYDGLCNQIQAQHHSAWVIFPLKS